MRGQPKLIKLTDKNGELKSSYWYIGYYDGRRSRRISTGCEIGTQDKAAHATLAAFILESQRPLAKKRDEILIDTVLEDYFEEHGKNLASAKLITRTSKTLKKFWSGKTVAQITRGKCREYTANRQKQNISNGTIKRELSVLSAALNHSYKEGRLLSSPHIEAPPASPPRERYMTHEEVQRLLDACQSVHVYAYIMIALNTGACPAAIQELLWEQVDLENRIIHFNLLGRSQTNKRRASVPINDQLHNMLKDMYRHRECQQVLSWRGYPAGAVRGAFDRAAKKAGLKDVTLYTLRHTAATWMAQGGAEMWQIAQVLGHSSISTTVKHYLKHSPSHLKNAVDILGGVRKNCAKDEE